MKMSAVRIPQTWHRPCRFRPVRSRQAHDLHDGPQPNNCTYSIRYSRCKVCGQGLDVARINQLLDGLAGICDKSSSVYTADSSYPDGGVQGSGDTRSYWRVVLGGIFAAIFQGAGMSAIIEASHYGFVSETGMEAIDELLSGGGLDSMMWTVSLIIIAMSFGGVLERTGMLNALLTKVLKVVNSTGSLVLATVLTCFFINLTSGDQYMSLVVPGRMFKDAYAERGLHPKNLSRVLEDAGRCHPRLSHGTHAGPLCFQPWLYIPLHTCPTLSEPAEPDSISILRIQEYDGKAA